MSTSDQIIDQPFGVSSDNKDFVERNLASTGKRIANALIDTIAYILICFLVMIGIGILYPESFVSLSESAWSKVIVYIVMILYYWIMELSTGKTLGKYITRTKIVKEDGSQPNALNVLGRTLCRFIPFDFLTYIGSKKRGLHDSVPKIYVIES